MLSKAVEVVKELLNGAEDRSVVDRLMTEDSVYISLTYDNPELTRVMPWAGTHKSGRDGVLYTFKTLNTFWTREDFDIRDAFGAVENVALFGSFRLRSKRLQQVFTSPFAVHAKLRDGQVFYLQYMEDTFGTGATFRKSGSMIFAGDPSGAEVRVGIAD